MRILFLLLSLLSISCTAGQDVSYHYPKMAKRSVTEIHHGIVVQDDYRNIENLKDTIVREWFKNQGILTNSIVDTLEQVKHFKSELKKIDGRTKTWAKKLKQDEVGNLYFLKRPIGEKDFKLYKKESGGKILELFDPKAFNPQLEKRFEINYYQPSWDGSLMAIAINTRGDFASEILILDIKTGERLDYTIENAAPDLFQGVSWLPNNKGFTYLHFPEIDKSKNGYKTNSTSVLHMVGDKNSRIPIFGNVHGVKMDPSFFPVTKITSSDSKVLIGYVANVDRFYDAYYCDVQDIQDGKPNWKKLYGIDDKVLYTEGKVKNNRYYYLSPKFEANYQVLSVNLNNPDFQNPKVESNLPDDEVVNHFVLDLDGMYITTTRNGVEASLYYTSSKSTDKVEIPFETGNVVLVPNSIKAKGLYIETDGWAVDLMRYLISGTEIAEQVILAEIPEFPEFKTIIVEEIEIKSFDSVMVPVSLIYDSKIPKTSARPTMIISYGAYGNWETPYFSPLRLSWISNGGAIAIAHIRGGGEKGKEWHEAGRKDKKSNSWKDIISVTEYLIKEGITTKDETILNCRSAGAISSAMAMIERPDLFQVFLSQVPFINPSRSSAGSYKKSSYLEFGDIEDSEEAKYILGMDPYLNLKKNVKYPATMISPSAKDDRLDLWESGKFIARLQEYNTSNLPILLDVNITAGHSRSSTESTATVYGFAKWVIEN
ncbi:hypothetical protein FGM00_13615 [Aggregatimonas sangjinii]|uniref:prolyl oligopeptidase n=1 Tax=Aggregatimonas sangjinii TaxID=2583587 RepID=A0A5B7SSB0_9FLAO|nr:prolyl oligopeptidase family serine peptidase [Aggregatimonas sangjinii]QCX01102.1 hypothetical protein FGM00_13615 [Aggregatimonas sangjinii]